jgi:hypothetical protein
MTIDEFKNLTLEDVIILAATEPATDASWWSLLGRKMISTGALTVGAVPVDEIEHWYVATGGGSPCVFDDPRLRDDLQANEPDPRTALEDSFGACSSMSPRPPWDGEGDLGCRAQGAPPPTRAVHRNLSACSVRSVQQ